MGKMGQIYDYLDDCINLVLTANVFFFTVKAWHTRGLEITLFTKCLCASGSSLCVRVWVFIRASHRSSINSIPSLHLSQASRAVSCDIVHGFSHAKDVLCAGHPPNMQLVEQDVLPMRCRILWGHALAFFLQLSLLLFSFSMRNTGVQH